MNKILLFSTTLLMLCSCSNNKTTQENLPSDMVTDIQSETVGPKGQWRLDSYRVDCESTQIEQESEYILSFDSTDGSFGVTTDCNSLGGIFEISNDTIRFKNILVTEMACDNMIVEENMIRLFNDSASYAICKGDTVFYTAPGIGNAVFVQKPE